MIQKYLKGKKVIIEYKKIKALENILTPVQTNIKAIVEENKS